MHPLDLLYAFLAAIAGGFVNAVAGGGTLITFPVLVALGIPAVSANLTNTIALCPGYISGVFAQAKDFPSQKQRLIRFLPASIAGGVLGGVLLIFTNEDLFRKIIPFLILAATILLSIQKIVKEHINKRREGEHLNSSKNWISFLLIFLASIYGGYFGAGLGVILMSILGVVANDSLNKLNVLKQAISFSINISAAIFFSFSGRAVWSIVLVMAIGASAGGIIGGKVSGKIRQEVLRWVIVIIGLSISIVYFLKLR